jgi:hypothetical protein
VTRLTALALALIALVAVAAEPAFAAKKPAPRLGRTVVLKPAGGKVFVKQPGKKPFRLTRATAVRMGTQVDTLHGKTSLTSKKAGKGTQSGVFSQGAFKVTQRTSDGMTDLTLTGGDFGVCTANRVFGKPLTAAANKRRRLFGRAHGRFRTRGRNSSATVRGTDWLTEDRCTGTVIENKSASQSSKVETESGDLHREIDPGQTITYYCNRRTIEPDTYCVMLLAYPDQGIIAGGLLTQADVETYRFCVQAPNGQVGCSDPLPLSGDDEQSFRLGVFACPVRQVGTFEVGWTIDDQTLLYPTLSLTLNVEGPNAKCETEPPSDSLPKL